MKVVAASVGRTATRAAPLRRRRPPARLLIPVGTTVGLLGLWELFARTGVLPEEVPPFTDIVSWLVGQLGDPAFWTSVRQTVWQWFAGLIIGGVVGIVLGVTLGAVPLVQRLLNVPLEFLRPIPAIVYLPLLILVLGSRPQTGILLASLGRVLAVVVPVDLRRPRDRSAGDRNREDVRLDARASVWGRSCFRASSRSWQRASAYRHRWQSSSRSRSNSSAVFPVSALICRCYGQNGVYAGIYGLHPRRRIARCR